MSGTDTGCKWEEGKWGGQSDPGERATGTRPSPTPAGISGATHLPRQGLAQGPLPTQQCPDPGESSLPREGGTSLPGGQAGLNGSKRDLG